jgi:hypothetical protein
MSRVLYNRSKGNCAWLISAWHNKVSMLRSELEMVFRFGAVRQKVSELDWDNGNHQIHQADIVYVANTPSDLT